MNNNTVAHALGWFSIGLGVAEVAAPKQLAEFLGMEKSATLLRIFGAREMGAGIGILAQDQPTPWLWARVAGDVLDLAALSPGLAPSNEKRGRVAFAIGTVAAITALDVLAATEFFDRESAYDLEASDLTGGEEERTSSQANALAWENQEIPAI